MGLKPADLARWTRFAAKGGIGKCVAQCDCVAESSDDLMFLKVCCLLDFSASFASSLEQDDEITVLLQIPDLENFSSYVFPLLWLRELSSNPILHRATVKASSVDSLVWTSSFLAASRNLS